MSDLLTVDSLTALATLAAMEVILGIDNLVFIALLTGRLPPARRALARRLGLGLALASRVALLLAVSWVMGLTAPLLALWGRPLSGRDLILLGGGVFLIAKATWEIYDRLEVEHAGTAARGAGASFALVLLQILALDVVFSLDSVITAIGMARDVRIMVAAIVLAMVVMVLAVGAVSRFIERHPSLKILALAFLLLIGVLLVAEGTGTHVDKGYIYSAMTFALFVELLNMRYRRHQRPVTLHSRFENGGP